MRKTTRTRDIEPEDEAGARERARVARHYGEFARDPRRQRAWAADNPGNVAIREEVGLRLRCLVGDTFSGSRPVLDAGCGTGYWLRWLALHGVAPARLHGIDLLPARVAAAGACVPGARVREGDVRRLPYDDGTFGLVLMFTVLSSQGSAYDMRRSLLEARRVAGPGGAVVVWDVRRSYPGRRSTRAVGSETLRRGLGPEVRSMSVTVLPPLARRLGRATGWAYPRLARVPVLRTHRMSWVRI